MIEKENNNKNTNERDIKKVFNRLESALLTLKSKNNEDTIIIKSNCAHLRPVVFNYKDDFIDEITKKKYGNTSSGEVLIKIN